MQNLSDILPLIGTPEWPSHHVSENQEFQHSWYSFCKTWDNREMIAETQSNIPRLRSPRLGFFNILFLQNRDSYSNCKSCRIRSDPFG